MTIFGVFLLSFSEQFLFSDLNSMEPPASVPKVMINQDEHKEFNIEVVPNLAEHELVTGPRYMPKDFRCATPIHHGTHTSGVMSKQ